MQRPRILDSGKHFLARPRHQSSGADEISIAFPQSDGRSVFSKRFGKAVDFWLRLLTKPHAHGAVLSTVNFLCRYFLRQRVCLSRCCYHHLASQSVAIILCQRIISTALSIRVSTHGTEMMPIRFTLIVSGLFSTAR